VLGLGVVWVASGLRVVRQWERAVVFRFGKVQHDVRGPGLTRITPVRDRLRKVNMQIVTMPVPAQDGITRDNVTVKVDAVVYFKVVDPVRVVVDVQDYRAAIGQVAQTSLRSIIGKSDLDDLLSNRERLNQGLELMIDSPALGWGVAIDRVEIKDVALPETMKRSMSRQAEAERERRARVISADGELQASAKLAQAAAAMSRHPAALQLRLLETVVQVASEKNSTLVLPFPVELLRFLEASTGRAVEAAANPAAAEPPAAEIPPGPRPVSPEGRDEPAAG
jgi:regulator of protease activity HflC (stomatin/prohibitin superfamily)